MRHCMLCNIQQLVFIRLIDICVFKKDCKKWMKSHFSPNKKLKIEEKKEKRKKDRKIIFTAIQFSTVFFYLLFLFRSLWCLCPCGGGNFFFITFMKFSIRMLDLSLKISREMPFLWESASFVSFFFFSFRVRFAETNFYREYITPTSRRRSIRNSNRIQFLITVSITTNCYYDFWWSSFFTTKTKRKIKINTFIRINIVCFFFLGPDL